MHGVVQLYTLQTTPVIQLRMIDILLLRVLRPLSEDPRIHSVLSGEGLLSQMMPGNVSIFPDRN